MVRTILIVAACGIALYLVWRVRLVLRLIGISLFFALALVPMVDAIAAKIRVPRALIILGVYLVLIAGVALIGYVVVPSLVKEVHQLSRDAPGYAGDLRHNATFRHYDNRYHITTKLVQDARRLPQLLGHLVGPLKDVTVQAFSLIAQLTTVLAISFLLVLHGRQYVHMGLSLTGPRRGRYRQLIIQINKAVADYILATLTVSFPAATIVWVVFIVVWQRFEDYVVQPLVYRRALRVNPIVTIVSVLAGASLLGILGALLAIPTAAAIQIVLRDWWANRTHEQPAPVS